MAFTSADLVGHDAAFPDHWALVGPALGGRTDATAFPWEWLDGDAPVVLVSLGTVILELVQNVSLIALVVGGFATVKRGMSSRHP